MRIPYEDSLAIKSPLSSSEDVEHPEDPVDIANSQESEEFNGRNVYEDEHHTPSRSEVRKKRESFLARLTAKVKSVRVPLKVLFLSQKQSQGTQQPMSMYQEYNNDNENAPAHTISRSTTEDRTTSEQSSSPQSSAFEESDYE